MARFIPPKWPRFSSPPSSEAVTKTAHGPWAFAAAPQNGASQDSSRLRRKLVCCAGSADAVLENDFLSRKCGCCAGKTISCAGSADAVLENDFLSRKCRCCAGKRFPAQ